jgi:uncharacterized protein YxeA
MKGRTILILILMLAVVLITSAFGAYQDQDKDEDEHADKHKDKVHKHATDNTVKSERTIDASNLTGASGAGMPHKVSHSYLDTSVKANGPYVDDGTNTYKGKAGGYNLHNSDSDSDSDNEHRIKRGDGHSDSGDSDSDDGDGDSGHETGESDFSRKIKYITKTVSNLFKEIFSKWGNQGSIMAPSGTEELNPDTMYGGGVPGTLEGLSVRDKIKKQARQGMRKLRNTFRGRK